MFVVVKNMDNFMSLKIEAISRNEAFARSVVGAFCVELNPTLDQINDVKTAVSEAVTNCIVHGYNKNGGIITINAKIIDNSIHIEIIDNGIGIGDITKARQPFFTTRDDDERSGMGFTVMESFMDELFVENIATGGSKVKMVKNFDMNFNVGDNSNC